jgi:hypothetical protein
MRTTTSPRRWLTTVAVIAVLSGGLLLGRALHGGATGQTGGLRPAAAADATPTATARPTATPLPPPPTFPAQASAPQPTRFIMSGGGNPSTTATCDRGRSYPSQIFGSPGNWPTTVSQLYARSDAVAVVTAQQQKAYWVREAGGPNDPPLFTSFKPETTTNFRVERMIKGAPVAWLQSTDIGALASELPTCKNLAWEIVNGPVPRLGHEYVLFLQLEGGQLTDWFGSVDRFPVVGGNVHPMDDEVSTALDIAIQPQSVDSFIASLRS